MECSAGLSGACTRPDGGEGTTAGLVTKQLSVKVALRMRPLMPAERTGGARTCVRLNRAAKNQVVIGTAKKNQSFTFDAAYDSDATQELIFEQMASPLVERVLEGYNATVFAYGQTGSGKTHTMGSSNRAVEELHVGLLPRAIQMIFNRITGSDNDLSIGNTAPEFLLRVSFLEIYNETLKDLLNPSTLTKEISVREDAEGSVIITGVKEQVVSTYEEAMRCLENGCAARTTGSTGMNDQSSRSHAIFTLIYEKCSVNDAARQPGTAPGYITSKFHMVDLAGSERNKRTNNTGSRFKESVAINYGLLALGNVISALGDDKKRGRVTHVPYRESKLTRILQDSLGGNSTTVMIACISPADNSFEETLNTLKYANRARNIKNTPVVNRDAKNGQLKDLRSGLHSLQMELLRASSGSGGAASSAVQKKLEDMLQSQGASSYARQLLSQVGQSALSGAGGTELGGVLLDRLRELEAEHTQAKKSLVLAEANVVELSELCLQLRSRARIHEQKVRSAQMICDQVATPGADHRQLIADIMLALPAADEMRIDMQGGLAFGDVATPGSDSKQLGAGERDVAQVSPSVHRAATM
jgi:hypothetical protein